MLRSGRDELSPAAPVNTQTSYDIRPVVAFDEDDSVVGVVGGTEPEVEIWKNVSAVCRMPGTGYSP